MRRSFSWRLVKFLAVLALLVLSAPLLIHRVTQGKPPPKPSPVPAEEYSLINPQSYRFILNQPHACADRNPFLVFMVPVSPQEAGAREAIRRTWGSPRPDGLTLFYVGLPQGGQGSRAQAELQKESRTHGDLIQISFQDSYQNLTIKTLMMMSWLATYCPNASYAMKVDADIFVNVFYLLTWLRSSPRQGFITGSVIWDGRPRRDRTSKWFVSEERYPEDRFPPYVSGAGYVLSADLAARISWASRFVRMVPLEDVYVGLCLQVLDVRPVYSWSLWSFRNLFEIRNLEYDRCTFAGLLIVNGFQASQLLQVWEDFSRGRSRC